MRAFIFLVLLSISNLVFAQLPQKVSDVGDIFRWQSVLLKNHIVYTTYNEKAFEYDYLFSSQGNSFDNIKICDSISQLISATKEKCFFIRKFDEIWVTDGTKSNTKMIFKLPKNFQFNRETSFTFTPSGDYLYFQTKDTINGAEFWVTDGSGNANSTKMLGPFFSESDRLGSAVGFNQGVILSVTNRTPPAFYDTADVYYFNKDSQKPVNLTKGYPRWDVGFTESAFIPKVFKNKAYFAFDHRIWGYELFETDGTFAGTKVIDINPGSGNSYPKYPFIEFGKLFVSAKTRPGLYSNMVTIDESGIENILPFQTLTLDNDYAVNANGIFLEGTNDTIDNRGWELWKTDGTKAGTSFVFDTKPGPQSGNPRFFSSVSNTIAFEANGKVFTSNGTDIGTIEMPIEDSLLMARSFQGYDDKIFFVGKLAKNNYHLYKYEKTGKARKIAPIGSESAINPLGSGNGSVDYGHNFLFNWKGEIYFLANYGQGKKLYKIGANLPNANNTILREEAQVQIFPNPAFSILNIQLNDMVESEINYSIINSEGKLMQKLDGVSVDNNHAQVSIENLNAGMYFIMIESKNSKSYKRFIKQ
jgi:ELWxxDGT repeat protein